MTLVYVQQLPATGLAASGVAGMVGMDSAAVEALEEAGREVLHVARECLGLPDEPVCGC